jgi:NADH:ubiquinone oxidoreductase subunit 2 (subunit N)
MHNPSEDAAELPAPSPGIAFTAWATALGTLFLGVFPSWVLDFAGKSANFMR